MSLLLALALWLAAPTAMSAEITAVRIGRHAEFSRIVFELDRLAGYRVELADPSSEAAELIVSLEATTIPRRLESSWTLIDYVDVTLSGTRSIARIRLLKEGLQFKELILANPPRIVIDVFEDRAAVEEVAKAPPTLPEQTSPASQTRPKLEPVETEPEPPIVVAQRPDPEPAPVVDVVDGIEVEVVEPAPMPAFEEQPAAVVQDDVVAVDEELAGSDGGEAASDEAELAGSDEGEADPADEILAGLRDLFSSSMPIEPKEIEEFAKLAPPPPKSAVEPAPRSMVAKTTQDGGRGWMTWALGAVGLILLGLGGLLVAKRGSGGEVDYADEDDGAIPADPSVADVNPFKDMGSDPAQTPMSMDADHASDSEDSEDSEHKESESVVFDDSAEEQHMDVMTGDDVNESLGMPPAVGGIPEEFQQMMRDMSSRVEALEGRVEELVEARDRLERQVAAQTEELRVQRAAIARTQRAVRNLARPEGEGEPPTEPVLREPDSSE